MSTKKLIPYSVYIPEEYHNKLKEAAKQRKASSLVRDALIMIMDGGDIYKSGYNKALADAAQVIYDCKEAQMIAVNRRDLGVVLAEKIDALKQ